jgi:hypothetical protein
LSQKSKGEKLRIVKTASYEVGFVVLMAFSENDIQGDQIGLSIGAQ